MLPPKLLLLCFLACLLQDAQSHVSREKRREIERNLPDIVREGFRDASDLLEREGEAARRHPVPREGISRRFAQQHKTSEKSKRASICSGVGLLEASKLIVSRYEVDDDSVNDLLTSLNVDSWTLPSINTTQQCESRSQSCNPNYPYRRIDGSCNNLENGLGAAVLPFKRMLSALYDEVDLIRGQVSGTLPNPRTVSVALNNLPAYSTSSIQATQLSKLWGQFLDHDITLTPESKALIGDQLLEIPCCDDGEPTPNASPDCAQIDVTGDPFYITHGVACLPFIRSLAYVAPNGGLGTREQLNQITAFIDGSNVYGSSEQRAALLRDSAGGLGKMKTNVDAELSSCPVAAPTKCMPYLPETEPTSIFNYFIAGDVRANESPSLTGMHTTFLRYHNMLAEKFKLIDPNFSDEFIFQETRRIVGALIQHISYYEFLPSLLGKDAIEEYSLHASGNIYDPEIDPSIANVFATAAYRFGHTMVGEVLKGKGSSTVYPLYKHFFDNIFMKQDPSASPSNIVRGESELNAEYVDTKLGDTLTNKLFAVGPDYAFGGDLMARNILRGRDHGLRGYNEWRRFCGLDPFESFDKMRDELNPSSVDVFEVHYNNVSDVDLFPAALAEKAKDGLIGPTFVCILSQQFRDTKFGDRFWHENRNQPKPFTENQLEVIGRTTLASVLCEALKMSNDQIQPFPMLVSGPGNTLKDCKEFTSVGVIQNLAQAWGRQGGHHRPPPNGDGHRRPPPGGDGPRRPPPGGDGPRGPPPGGDRQHRPPPNGDRGHRRRGK